MGKIFDIKTIALAAIASLFSLSTTACEDDPESDTQKDYVANYKRINTLDDILIGDYHFTFYSDKSELTIGYNDIYIALTDANGNYVEDYEITSILPIMDMGKMKHSTAVGEIEQVAKSPIFHTWISFVMATEGDNHWELSFDYRIGQVQGTTDVVKPVVNALSDGISVIKSFKTDDATYYVTLANWDKLASGTNSIKAYINKRTTATDPYQVTDDFIIKIDPRMPDMGNHSSANNTDLEWNQNDKAYEGVLNLSMTGYWRINLIIEDNNGNVVAGSAVDDDNEKSSLAWGINI